MADYPLGIDGNGKPGGRLRYLEDSDHDGSYDRSTLLLDNLNFPTGVMAWRDGVLLTAAPEILFIADVDGDGKVDKRKVLYRGFVEGNQQHRVNSLRWGIDNWVYLANGDSGGTIESVATGKSVSISGRDLRIRPDSGELDAQAGQTQFGRDTDDWGDWFGCNNSNPMWQYVLADHYLRRNPHIASAAPRRDVPEQPGAAPVYPTSRTLERFNSPGTENRFTSAASTMIYRDDLFGPQFAGNAFVAEPVHNLVHREVMVRDGLLWKSRRAADEASAEFLTSTDNWFRPTMIRTGPDGGVWIADMYRETIEHPEWIPKAWQDKLDLRAGHDRGRIWRVLPVAPAARPIPRLDRLELPELIAALDSPSGWQRDMVQRMILWRGDKRAVSAVAPLERLVEKAERPQARLHALSTLDGLDRLRADLLLTAMADEHPGVRRHAVRMCETRADDSPQLAAAMLARLGDDDRSVVLQLACSLGEPKKVETGGALGAIAARYPDDVYLLSGVYSSLHSGNLGDALAALLENSKEGVPPGDALANFIDMALKLKDDAPVRKAAARIAGNAETAVTPSQLASLAGLIESLARTDRKLEDFMDSASKAGLERIIEEARRQAADSQGDEKQRITALRLLGAWPGRTDTDLKLMSDLISPQSTFDLQAAAVNALAATRDEALPARLLAGWDAAGPMLRGRILDVLLERPAWAVELTVAVERREVLPQDIDAARRQRLLHYGAKEVRTRAAGLFDDASSSDRAEVVERHAKVALIKGDAAAGKQVFAKRCATCHALEGVGHAIGPDLLASANRSADWMLSQILDPNRAVEARYTSYVAATEEGHSYSGILVSETGNSITLALQDGKQQVILRSDMDELKSTGKSLMPEGLEKDLSEQDLADVLAYLGASAPPAKNFPLSKVAIVRAADDGSLKLPAASARIYGPSLILEEQYGNLGYWQNADDHAIWSIVADRKGRYRATIDYACDDGSAGNTLKLTVGPHELTWVVEGTGSWDKYRAQDLGEIDLATGPHEVVVRSAGKLRPSLIDLRAIRLAPVTPR